jgi:hypothetical protein
MAKEVSCAYSPEKSLSELVTPGAWGSQCSTDPLNMSVPPTPGVCLLLVEQTFARGCVCQLWCSVGSQAPWQVIAASEPLPGVPTLPALPSSLLAISR